jgi:hypothetical protein
LRLPKTGEERSCFYEADRKITDTPTSGKKLRPGPKYPEFLVSQIAISSRKLTPYAKAEITIDSTTAAHPRRSNRPENFLDPKSKGYA